MPRRFQFSLRALLVLTALASLLLGGRHLLETYGSYLEVTNIAVGESMTIKGRIVHLFGPPKIYFEVESHNVETPSLNWTTWGWLERSWLCCYDFDQASPIDSPGDWIVEASKLDWISSFEATRTVALRKTFIVAAEK